MVRRIKGLAFEDSRRESGRIIDALDYAQLTSCLLIGAVRHRSVTHALCLEVRSLPNDKP